MGASGSVTARKTMGVIPEISERNGSLCRTNEKSSLKRLDCSESVKIVSVSGTKCTYELEYCYVCQRGYYPNENDKPNQDSYLICENFMGDRDTHIFGVFDGHGETGDLCSYFAAEKFTSYLEGEVKSSSSGTPKAFETPEMTKIFTNSFEKLNKALHKSNINDSLSGTTAIVVAIKGDSLYVSNVGDSRSILGLEIKDKKLLSLSLSSDQTPFRSDERERVKKLGASIRTIEQIEGSEPLHENWLDNGGDALDDVPDPPRVWDRTFERPGCAFTRSIGDVVAEKVGVCAQPEVLTRTLSFATDRFLIIASDGVFEFLTNQMVLDIIAKEPNDILKAARAVAAESYNQWLKFDERTDDITIILIKINELTSEKSSADSITPVENGVIL